MPRNRRDDEWENPDYDGPLSPWEQAHGGIPWGPDHPDWNGGLGPPNPDADPDPNPDPDRDRGPDADPTPKPTPTPQPAPGPGPAPGPRPVYRPPSIQPSPFIMPNGQIPPGMPYSPNPQAVAMQNAALQRALQTDAVSPYQFNPAEQQIRTQQEALLQRLMGTPAFTPPVDPNRDAQDRLLQQILTQPAFGQDYINTLNEQQKEIALGREQYGNERRLQHAASRGVASGGTLQAAGRRASEDTTRQLLESQRDIRLQTEQANRGAYERALPISQGISSERESQARTAAALNAQVQTAIAELSDSILGGRQDRASDTQTTNRSALLSALGMSENIYGGRQDRGLDVSRMGEMIRQFDQGLLNRQSEFGSRLTYDYDSLNNDARSAWLNYLARLAGR